MRRTFLVTYCLLLFSFIFSSLHAQGYYFGRNKVQYTDFNWQIMKTEHFDIYYYPEMQKLAEKGAFLLKRATVSWNKI